MDRVEQIAGVVLGTAVGDALGLPREGLSRRRVARLFGEGELRHRLLPGYGMVSDDTEHTCMVGQALLASPNHPEEFGRALAWQLRWWVLGLPAGVGLATLRSSLKLWCGFPPERSGVPSAGNVPAMRAAILGVCCGKDQALLREMVRVSTRLTHTDPRAEQGALLVALAAWYGISHAGEFDPYDCLEWLRQETSDVELGTLLEALNKLLRQDATSTVAAASLGLDKGVTGYIYHTVPMALYCWLRSPTNFRQAVQDVILLGGDTDTTGAIVGALAGSAVGASGIPGEWISGLAEWPRSVTWMRQLSERLARQFPLEGAGERCDPMPIFWPGLPIRNTAFSVIILGHALRRLFPPY